MGWTRFNDFEEERIDRDLVRYRVVSKKTKRIQGFAVGGKGNGVIGGGCLWAEMDHPGLR